MINTIERFLYIYIIVYCLYLFRREESHKDNQIKDLRKKVLPSSSLQIVVSKNLFPESLKFYFSLKHSILKFDLHFKDHIIPCQYFDCAREYFEETGHPFS